MCITSYNFPRSFQSIMAGAHAVRHPGIRDNRLEDISLAKRAATLRHQVETCRVAFARWFVEYFIGAMVYSLLLPSTRR